MVSDHKKEQEREELHRAIWAIADELRGAVDGILKIMCLGQCFTAMCQKIFAVISMRGRRQQGMRGFAMPVFRMKRQKKQEKIWLRQRDSLSCPVSFSAM